MFSGNGYCTAHLSSQIAHDHLRRLIPSVTYRRHVSLMRQIFKPLRLITGYLALMLPLEFNKQAVVSIPRRRQENIRHARFDALPLELRRFNFVPLPAVRGMIHVLKFRERTLLQFRPREQLFLFRAFQRFSQRVPRCQFCFCRHFFSPSCAAAR